MDTKITVITTVFNCEKFISSSVKSILSQTFTDFEYIIVNDGSTDGTTEILQNFSKQDKRIKLIELDRNYERVISLNTALEKARGEYIAIQDADDISMPDRLYIQSKFLDENPGYVLVGANILIINEDEEIISRPKRPRNNHELQFSLLFRCTFANPSLMYRKKIMDEFNLKYEEDFIHAEDFRLISKLSHKGKVFNLEKPLVKYRKHEQNNSKVNFDFLNNGSIIIVKENLKELGFDINEEQIFRIRNLISSKGIRKEFLYDDVNLVFNSIKAFKKKYHSEKNEEILFTLKRMLNWLGRRNIFSKYKYFALYTSILNYYFKETIIRRI